MIKKPIIIAEIANSHEGYIKKLTELVDATIRTKPNIIKFQFFIPHELLVPNHPMFKLFESLMFSEFEWKKIFNKVKKHKIIIYTDVLEFMRNHS